MIKDPPYGYSDWLMQVDTWAESHGITREQALSIIGLDSYKNGMEERTLSYFYSWALWPDYVGYFFGEGG